MTTAFFLVYTVLVFLLGMWSAAPLYRRLVHEVERREADAAEIMVRLNKIATRGIAILESKEMKQ